MVIVPKGIYELQLVKANIGEDYWECDFSNFKGPKEAKEVSIKYLKSLASMKQEGLGILYGGPPGPGKTTLAMIVMKYLVRANWNVVCTSLGEIVEMIQKSWKSDDKDTEDFITHARRADFLFIDDVGKEHRGQSGFVQTVFDNLIRYRVQHRLPTFITTNLTRGELHGLYGDSLISLLEGKMLTCVVNGADYRRTSLKDRNRKLMDQ